MAASALTLRAAAVALATVGLFLCPFRCAEAADARLGGATACSAACGCGDCHGESDDSTPTPTDDCRGECVCKALLDGVAKISPADLGLLTVAVGHGDCSVPAAGLPRSVGREASPTHPDAESGSALRVAISSLIL